MTFKFNSIITQSSLLIVTLGILTVIAGAMFASTFSQVVELQLLLNNATFQRAEVFRLSEFARRYSDATTDDQQEAIYSGMSIAISSFDDRQQIFFSGDLEANIEAIDETDLLYPIAEDMEEAWQRYRTTLTGINDIAHKDMPEELDGISVQATLLYSFADRMERGIAFDLSNAQVESQRIFTAILIVIALILITNSLFLYRIITGLRVLIQVARNFAVANYDLGIVVKSFSEVIEVRDALFRMAGAVLDREQSLQKLNQTLELRVDERTIELRQARDTAIEAQALAQENSRLKSEFLSTMSHELRTPLNAILGYTGLLMMGIYGTIDEAVKARLLAIEESGKHLLGLINDVLDLSKIEAGRIEITNLPFSIRELAETWIQSLKILADADNLPFVTEIDPKLPDNMMGDKERLTQIVINLISNAIKFTEEGQVTLRLKPAQSPDKWLIEVEDTGQGIAPEAQEYIFDQFRQVDGSYSRNHGGTGLGLAIARKLCEAMGGTIRLKSVVGEGSTFTVILPLLIQTDEEVERVVNGSE